MTPYVIYSVLILEAKLLDIIPAMRKRVPITASHLSFVLCSKNPDGKPMIEIK
jgi:hypothetical protein